MSNWNIQLIRTHLKADFSAIAFPKENAFMFILKSSEFLAKKMLKYGNWMEHEHRSIYAEDTLLLTLALDCSSIFMYFVLFCLFFLLFLENRISVNFRKLTFGQMIYSTSKWWWWVNETKCIWFTDESHKTLCLT